MKQNKKQLNKIFYLLEEIIRLIGFVFLIGFSSLGIYLKSIEINMPNSTAIIYSVVVSLFLLFMMITGVEIKIKK